MEVKTKFNLGDKVFVLFDNKVYPVVITYVEMSVDRTGLVVNYKIKFPAGGETKVAESRLFETKRDLLNSL